MTAQRAAALHTVVLRRSERPGWWPRGFWSALVGCGLRMPVGVVGDTTYEGLLVAADESDAEEIVLTFEDVHEQPDN